MKILALNPPFHRKFSRPQRSPAVTKSGTLYYPLWLAYTVGLLEENGHDVTFIDAPARGITLEQVLKTVQDETPGLIIVDTSTPSINNDVQVAQKLRETAPDSFILLVGTHVSALPEESMGMCPAADAVARREYDHTVRELATLLAETNARPDDAKLAAITGITFRNGSGEVVANPDRELIENLDELPWVSRVYLKHLEYTDYFNQNSLHPMVTLVTSRGCPFKCSFCVYPQTLTGRRYRFRSIGDVVEEMRFVVDNFPGVKCIFFEDDTLTANKKRCMEFAQAVIDSGVKIPWTANSRIELDYETLKLLRQAGCRELCVGFESGDDKILKQMRKGTTREKMFKFMRDATRAGVLVHGCFMVGFPGEDQDSVQKTIDLAKQLNPDTAQFYPVMVYPGTEAYDEYREKNWLTAQDYDQWLTPEGLHNCVVRNENFDSAGLVRVCDDARRQFYLRPRYILYKAVQMLRHPSEIRRTFKAGRTFLKYLLRGSKV
jgi:anaerobic magnesium-protoporphyrin IX monomethyl ester cyclase